MIVRDKNVGVSKNAVPSPYLFFRIIVLNARVMFPFSHDCKKGAPRSPSQRLDAHNKKKK